MKRTSTMILAVTVMLQAAICMADKPEWRSPQNRAAWDPMEGKAAPSLEKLTGWMNTDARSWDDLKGKVVILDFWGTWCGPCVQQVPKLQAMHEKYAEQGLVILGVHSANGSNAMPRFVQQRGLKYAFAVDSTGALSKSVNLKFYPTYFVIGPEGKVRVAGADRNKLEEIVDDLIKGAKPADPKALIGKWPKPVQKKLYAKKDLRGQKAPDLGVEKWLINKPDTKGKMVAVVMWASWCDACKQLAPYLHVWQEAHKDDLAVIAISNESESVVRKFTDRYEIAFSVGIDTKGTLLNSIVGPEGGIPHVMIIDTQGIVRWQGFPFSGKEQLNENALKGLFRRDPVIAARHLAKAKKEGDAKKAPQKPVEKKAPSVDKATKKAD